MHHGKKCKVAQNVSKSSKQNASGGDLNPLQAIIHRLIYKTIHISYDTTSIMLTPTQAIRHAIESGSFAGNLIDISTGWLAFTWLDFQKPVKKSVGLIERESAHIGANGLRLPCKSHCRNKKKKKRKNQQKKVVVGHRVLLFFRGRWLILSIPQTMGGKGKCFVSFRFGMGASVMSKMPGKSTHWTFGWAKVFQ